MAAKKTDSYLKEVDITVQPQLKAETEFHSPPVKTMLRTDAAAGRSDTVSVLGAQSKDLYVPESSLTSAGISEIQPQVIGLFEWLPPFAANSNSDPDGSIVSRSGDSVRPTAIAELIDLQITSDYLQNRKFQSCLKNYLKTTTQSTGGGGGSSPGQSTGGGGGSSPGQSTGGGGGSSPDPFRDSLAYQNVKSFVDDKFKTADQIIKFYNVFWQAISDVVDALDLKNYTLNEPNIEILLAGDTNIEQSYVEDFALHSDASIFFTSNPSMSSAITETSMASYFVNHFDYRPSTFNMTSNSKIFNSLVSNLYEFLVLGSPSIHGGQSRPDVSSDDMLGSFDVPDISSYTVSLANKISRLSKLAKSPGDSLRGSSTSPSTETLEVVLEEYSLTDYLDLMSSLPRDPVQRIAYLCHVVNRGLIIGRFIRDTHSSSTVSALRSVASNLTTTSAGSITGESTTKSTPFSSTSGNVQDIKNSIGYPTGRCLDAPGKMGFASLCLLRDNTDTTTSRSVPKILPFELSDQNFTESGRIAPFTSGLDFFVKRIFGEYDGETTLADAPDRIKTYSSVYKDAFSDLSYSCMTRLHGETTLGTDEFVHNGEFYKSILSAINGHLNDIDSGKSASTSQAGELAILELAYENPKIGLLLNRFFARIAELRRNSEGSMLSPFSVVTAYSGGTAPADALRDIPTDASDVTSETYQFYLDSVAEIHTSADERAKIINDYLVPLAMEIQKVTQELSSNSITTPWVDDPSLPSGSPYTYIVNSYEKITDSSSIETEEEIRALSSGWGAILYYTMYNTDSLLFKIYQNTVDFENKILNMVNTDESIVATVGPAGAGGRTTASGVYGLGYQERCVIGLEVAKIILSENISIRIGNTGFETFSQEGAISPDGTTVEDYYIDRVRIDLYDSELVSVNQATFKTGAFDLASMLDPSETALKIDRDLSDAMALILNEDIEVSNILHILRTIGEKLDTARSSIYSAISDMAADAQQAARGPASPGTVYAVDINDKTDVTILEDVTGPVGSGVQSLRKYYLDDARKMLASLREDVSERTLTLLSPDQVSRMSADYLGFYQKRSGIDSGNNGQIPISKNISAAECHILRSFSKLPMFTPDQGQGNLKILSIGIPAGIIQMLREDLSRKISDDLKTRSSMGDVITAIPQITYLLDVNIHKKNLQDDFAVYRPKTFTFNPTCFILPTSTYGGTDGSSDPGTLVDSTNFYSLKIGNPDGGTQNFTLNSAGYTNYASYINDNYPTMIPYGTQGNYEIGFNHLASYCINRYLKLLAGINLDTSGFQFGDHGFLQQPNPESASLFNNMIDYATKNTNQTKLSGVLYLENLKRTAMKAPLFNAENYIDRCVNCTMFDRVVNVIIDPNSFERTDSTNAAKPDTVTGGGGGGSPSQSTGGGGGGSPTPSTAQSASEEVLKSGGSCDEVSYKNYFVTLSLRSTYDTPRVPGVGDFTGYDIGTVPTRTGFTSGGGGGASPGGTNPDGDSGGGGGSASMSSARSEREVREPGSGGDRSDSTESSGDSMPPPEDDSHRFGGGYPD
jgi:hypothetical protein